MNLDGLYQEFETFLSQVDREFGRVFELFRGRMQCRKGCSLCCRQMFSISLLEAAYISRAVKRMDPEKRETLRARARRYLEQRRAQIEDRGTAHPTEPDLPITTGLRLTCPALDDDACQIYSVRPIICRKWGIPLFNPKKPTEVQACELNFQPGEEIEADGLIQPQAHLLEDWVRLKDAAKQEFNWPSTRYTVADALLNDYEAVLTATRHEAGNCAT